MNRDLDAEIVEKIFGWRLILVGPDFNGQNECEVLYPPNIEPTQENFYNQLPTVGKIHKAYAAPQYSNCLTTAINLCKHVKLPLSIIEMPTNPEILAKKALDWYLSEKI